MSDTPDVSDTPEESFGYPTADAAEAGIDPDALERLLQRSRVEVDSRHLPAAQIALARNGHLVATATFGAPESTRFIIYSCTKAVTAGAVWRVLDAGLLTRATLAADVIDGFAEGGKQSITLEHLLTHTAGIPDAEISGSDWIDPQMRSRCFATWALEWEPGTRFEYHGTSAHWALAAMIESATGRDFREFVRAEVIQPLGLPGLQLGTPVEDQAAVANVVSVGTAPSTSQMKSTSEGLGLDISAIGTSDESLLSQNDPLVRSIGQPAGGAISHAADMAMYYQALIENPGGLWSDEVLSAGTGEILCEFPDPMTGVPSNRTLGLLMAGDDGNAMMRGFGRKSSARAFGHMGAGGQVAWADPESGLSFCYLTSGLDRDPLAMGIRGDELSTLASLTLMP